MTPSEIPGFYLGTRCYIGICDTCRSIKQFTNQRTRDQWETHHPHHWETTDDE